MDKAIYDQIINLLDKSQKILLLTHAKADCDGLGSALSAYLVLKTLDKEAVVATNDPVAENMQFLPAIDILQNSLAASSDFIISLDTSGTAISKIKYNAEENRMNIIITPKDGTFSESDLSFQKGEEKFDLIMIFDTGNLEHLGPIYDRNIEMFYETPVINVDHHVSNTDYGQVNLVDVTSASTTEIFYEFLLYWEKKLNKKLVTEDIATLLLAGLITDTGSFQHANTSPRSMETAAKLLDLGARQQEIIKNIYKTKKLSTLKLWGIILSKVQVDPVHRMVWSTINKDDLLEAEASSDETEGIIDDLLTNAPGAEVIFLIKYNEEGYVSVSMRSTSNQVDVGKLCTEMEGGGHVRAAGFKIRDGRPFDQIVSEVIEKARQFQAKRLNIHPEEPSYAEATEGKPIGEEKKQITSQQKVRPEKSVPSAKPESAEPKVEKTEQTGQVTYLDFKAPKAIETKMEASPSTNVSEEKPPSAEAPSSAEATEGAPEARPEGRPEGKPVEEKKTETTSEAREKEPEAVTETPDVKTRRRRRRRRHRTAEMSETEPVGETKPKSAEAAPSAEAPMDRPKPVAPTWLTDAKPTGPEETSQPPEQPASEKNSPPPLV